MKGRFPLAGHPAQRIIAGVVYCSLTITTSKAIASAELVGVQFKAGHPTIGELLSDSAKCPAAYEENALDDDVSVLMEMHDAVVEIVGFTDDQECSGAECRALSLRRAQVVYDWLVAHGVSTNRLRAPVGRGSDLAIDSNETELGRQRNRRAELQLVR